MVLPDLRGGGAQRVFLTLAKEMVARGLYVDLLVFLDGGELRDRIPPGVRLMTLCRNRSGLSRLKLARDAVFGMIGYMRRNRPDAVLSTVTGTNLVTVLAHRLACSRSCLVLREAATLENLRHPGYRWAMRLGYRSADRIIVLTEPMRRQLVRELRLPENKISCISNPIDVELIERYSKESLPADFDASRPFVLAVGRLAPQKDYTTLLNAFSDVLASHRDLCLVVLGEGPERSILETEVRRLGLERRVYMRGFDTNPYRWMARAYLVVLSSRWEGHPNVLLEAKMLGVPIVSTEYDSSAREVAGEHAVLVPVGDSRALADGMCRALDAKKDLPSNAPDNEASVRAYLAAVKVNVGLNRP